MGKAQRTREPGVAIAALAPDQSQAPQTMFQLLQNRAAEHPDLLAVEDGAVALTYRDLSLRAERLAAALAAQGVVADDAVVLAHGRSLDFVVALFALWRIGALAVPVDPDTPESRLAEVIEDSAARLVLGPDEPQLRVEQVPILAVGRDLTIGECAAPPPKPGIDAAAGPAYCLYTSGSTGRPKGVLIPHRAIVNYSCATAARLDITRRDRCLQICSIGFDGAMHEIGTAIAAGACLVVYSQGRDVTTVGIDAFIDRCGISTTMMPTALWRIWVHEHAWASEHLPSCLRLVMTGGEKIQRSDFAAWRSLEDAGAPTLVNLYGPTETTVAVTMWSYKSGDVFAADDDVPIGSPVEGCRCYVVDDDLRPVATGEVGQLAIGGSCVGLGYLGRPAETAVAFVADPFAPAKGNRLYLTGDRVRIKRGGLFEFVGRADDQVKILGHRVETGEVECALRGHPDLADAAVVVSDDGHEKQLVAFCQPRPGRGVSAADLRDWLGRIKPHYLVPRRIELVASFPTSMNGKTDRRSLAARASAAQAAAPDAASGGTEAKLAAIWKLTLGVEGVTERDNFFDSGGHSLLVARLIWAIRQATGVQVSFRDFFADPTFAGIATLVRNAARQGTPVAPAAPAGSNEELAGRAPVTFQQRRLLNQAEQDFATAIRVVPVMFELSGVLDVDRLQRAIERTINRHAVFRTRFSRSPDGTWQQEVSDAAAFAVERAAVPAGEGGGHPRELAKDLASRWAFRGMNISAGELVRTRILTNGQDLTWLVLAFHHIAIDAHSLALLTSELFGVYARDAAAGPPETLYLRYAREQAARVQSGAYAEDLAFWAQYLDGAVPMALPRAGDGRPAEPELPRSCTKCIEGEALLRLRACAAAQGTTVFTLCLGSLAILLAEVAGQNDILVGIPHHNRPSPEYRDCVGYFVNSIPVRVKTSAYETVGSLLKDIQCQLQTAPQHLGVSMADVPLPRRPDCSRVFQVMMVDEHVRSSGAIDGVTIEPIRLAAPFIKADLDVGLSDRGKRMRLGFGFDAALFSDTDVSVWLSMLDVLLNRLATAPAGLDKLTVREAVAGLRG